MGIPFPKRFLPGMEMCGLSPFQLLPMVSPQCAAQGVDGVAVKKLIQMRVLRVLNGGDG